MADTIKLQVPLDPEFHREFKKAAVEDNFDMTQKVRELIREFLDNRNKS